MSNKIRVLQAIRQGLIGGGESHVLNLVNCLNKERFEPIVLSFTPGPMVDRLRANGIRTHVIPGKSPIDMQMWRQVKNLLQAERIDLIHVHGTRANMNLVWAAKQCKIPIIYTVHGWSFHPDQSYFIRNARITAERLLTRWADLTITVSDSNHKTGEELIKGFESKVIFNGIDIQRFRRDQPFDDIRASYGIPPDHTLVLFLARLTLQKDPLTLIDAFQSVAERHSNITLLMIGQGELEQDVATSIQQKGLQHRIICDKFRLDVPNVLLSGDIYCLPSLWEGQPIGLIEAMATGKAVVATHVDGTKELVKDAINGLLIDPQNPQQLAKAIEKLHTNNTLRKDLGEKAYKTVKDHYDASFMTHQIENAYLNVLNQLSYHTIAA